MGDILNVGTNQSCISQQESWIDTSMFLQKENYLGEFSNEAPSEDGGTIDEKALARLNLEVYSKAETDDSVQQAIEEELNAHINANDPHRDRAYTDSRIQNTSDNFTTQLTNLRTSLERLINNVQNTLVNNYALSSQLNAFVKKDGSTPFTNPQKGVDPTSKQHLATKNYVDRVADPKIREYLNSSEFRTLLNQISNSLIQEFITQLTQDLREQNERKELVISQALNDLNSRIIELSESVDELISNNIYEVIADFNSFKDQVSNSFDDIELVTANALNDLDSRINGLESTTDNIINNIISELQTNINNIIDDNELAVASALNDLNGRIIELNHDLDLINPKLETIPKNISINGKSITSELNQVDFKLMELIIKDSGMYNLLQLFSQYFTINVNIIPQENNQFTVTITINNYQIAKEVTYDQQNQPQCDYDQVQSGDPQFIINFKNIGDSIIVDFLKSIDKNTYTTYFYNN